VHAAAALISAAASPSQALGPSAIWAVSERHRHVIGGGTEVLEVRVHKDHGW